MIFKEFQKTISMPLEAIQKYVPLKTPGISLLFSLLCTSCGSRSYQHPRISPRLVQITCGYHVTGSRITEARGRPFNFLAFPSNFNFPLESFLKSINPSHLHECLAVVYN